MSSWSLPRARTCPQYAVPRSKQVLQGLVPLVISSLTLFFRKAMHAHMHSMYAYTYSTCFFFPWVRCVRTELQRCDVDLPRPTERDIWNAFSAGSCCFIVPLGGSSLSSCASLLRNSLPHLLIFLLFLVEDELQATAQNPCPMDPASTAVP